MGGVLQGAKIHDWGFTTITTTDAGHCGRSFNQHALLCNDESYKGSIS